MVNGRLFCFADHNFNAYTPSMMAASCVAAAVSEMTGFPPYQLLDKLQEITGVDPVSLALFLF